MSPTFFSFFSFFLFLLDDTQNRRSHEWIWTDELISVWILCLQLDFDAMTLFLISDFLQSVSVFPLSIYKAQRFYLVFNGSEMIFSIRGELMCWSVLFPRESEQIVPVHQMIWTFFFFSSHNRFYWLEPLAPQIQTPHKPPTKKNRPLPLGRQGSHRWAPPAALLLSALCVIRVIQAYRTKAPRWTKGRELKSWLA